MGVSIHWTDIFLGFGRLLVGSRKYGNRYLASKVASVLQYKINTVHALGNKYMASRSILFD